MKQYIGGILTCAALVLVIGCLAYSDGTIRFSGAAKYIERCRDRNETELAIYIGHNPNIQHLSHGNEAYGGIVLTYRDKERADAFKAKVRKLIEEN